MHLLDRPENYIIWLDEGWNIFISSWINLVFSVALVTPNKCIECIPGREDTSVQHPSLTLFLEGEQQHRPYTANACPSLLLIIVLEIVFLYFGIMYVTSEWYSMEYLGPGLCSVVCCIFLQEFLWFIIRLQYIWGTPRGQSYLHTLKFTYLFQILSKILWHKCVWLDTKGQRLWAEQFEFAPLTMRRSPRGAFRC